jgi:FkbM family methyltransferase
MTAICKLVARGCSFFENFFICAANLGWPTAVTLFLLRRYSAKPTDVYLRAFDRYFTFRGCSDRGVMSHFYKPGYRILDTAERPIKWIVDAGANIGDETVRFRYFHPRARIIAIEAEAGNFALLKRNVGKDAGITCLHKGLWPTTARLRIGSKGSNEGFFVTEVSESAPYDIDAVSLDKVREMFDIDRIDILKLDIEGAEYDVFSRNSENWIDKVNVVIFECADQDRSGMTAAIFRTLPSELFDCRLSGENIVMIRRDTGWTVKSEVFYQDKRGA